MSGPEPEVCPVVHVRLVAVINLPSEQPGERQPGGESPCAGQAHSDHSDGVVGRSRNDLRRIEDCRNPDPDGLEEHHDFGSGSDHATSLSETECQV